MNSVSDNLFLWSLALLVIGVMFSGYAFNPFRLLGKARQLVEKDRLRQAVTVEPEAGEKRGLRKFPLALMGIGVIGIAIAIAIS